MEVPRWVQGKSFLPVLSGDRETHKDAVFAQGGVEREAIERNRLLDERELYGRTTTQYDLKQKVILDEPDFMMRARMVRTRRYKYIYRLNGAHEFYDLEEDPAELRNQVDNPRYADAIANLRERLLHWMVESETNLPLLKGAYS
jgi:arylsulfatase A-like enzyme